MTASGIGEWQEESRLLTEAASSEAKRLGRKSIDLVCLVVAMSRRQNPELDLDPVLGQGVAGALVRWALASAPVGEASDVEEGLRMLAESGPEEFMQWLGKWSGSLRAANMDNVPEVPAQSSSSGGASSHSTANDSQSSSSEGVAKTTPIKQEFDFERIKSALTERVRGQDHAIERMARRLAMTKSGYDMRPERPDGVFLFVGPTGVGKTELARALAAAMFGSEDRLIRLDMSEYAVPHTVALLIGAPPGYAGSDKPAGWLSTRLKKNPDSVVLLDEIEKAHPEVWKVFLQAFDAGRITDSQGSTANVSETIFIMTSNIGAEVHYKDRLGFEAPSTDPDELPTANDEDVVKAVGKVMPPELVNRIDAVIPFKQLDAGVLREIAEAEIERVKTNLDGRGIDLTITKRAIEHLVATGYDPKFGARHLHRNIESKLLEEIAVLGAKDCSVNCDLVGEAFVVSLVE